MPTPPSAGSSKSPIMYCTVIHTGLTPRKLYPSKMFFGAVVVLNNDTLI